MRLHYNEVISGAPSKHKMKGSSFVLLCKSRQVPQMHCTRDSNEGIADFFQLYLIMYNTIFKFISRSEPFWSNLWTCFIIYMHQGESINKVTIPLTGVMFLISFKFPARSDQVEHCFLSRTLDRASYQSYCPNISCKMAGLVETWSNIEVCSVIRFLRLKGTSPACWGVRC
jgi:hypothetical protein